MLVELVLVTMGTCVVTLAHTQVLGEFLILLDPPFFTCKIGRMVVPASWDYMDRLPGARATVPVRYVDLGGGDCHQDGNLVPT